jgi:hypothetical protein
VLDDINAMPLSAGMAEEILEGLVARQPDTMTGKLTRFLIWGRLHCAGTPALICNATRSVHTD